MLNWRGSIRLEDDLTLSIWTYWLREDAQSRGVLLQLDDVQFCSRLSTRHKFRVYKHWNRIMERESSMERPEPPLRVKQEIRDMLITQLTVE